MKKIIFYIGCLARGGAERVLANLANEFYKYGFDVTIILKYREENEYPICKGIKKIYLPQNGYSNRIICFYKKICNIRSVLKSEKPILSLSFIGCFNIEFLLAAKGLKFKKYISVRNMPEFEFQTKKQYYWARILYPKADGVILQTKDAQKWFDNKGINIKSTIIPNQVAEQFFDKEYNGKRKNIVSVGRLDYQKNQDMLIRAFSKIADKTDENLVIYGQGPLKENLENLISELGMSERVKLGGLIEDVPDTIIGSKLFVLSSDFEGSPNALLESIALGIPSISTDCPCGGPKEIIEDGKNGFLVPVGNIDSLAEKMLYVLSLSDSELKCISENAKKSADRYRPEKIFKQWKDFLIGE